MCFASYHYKVKNKKEIVSLVSFYLQAFGDLKYSELFRNLCEAGYQKLKRILPYCSEDNSYAFRAAKSDSKNKPTAGKIFDYPKNRMDRPNQLSPLRFYNSRHQLDYIKTDSFQLVRGRGFLRRLECRFEEENG